MCYTQQDVFQILNIFGSAVYLLLALILVNGMKKYNVNRLKLALYGMFAVVTMDIKMLRNLDKSGTNVKPTSTEKEFARAILWIGFADIAFFWSAVGMNLAPGGGQNAFTNSGDSETQSWFIVGTILFSLVMISMIFSAGYWMINLFKNPFAVVPVFYNWVYPDDD